MRLLVVTPEHRSSTGDGSALNQSGGPIARNVVRVPGLEHARFDGWLARVPQRTIPPAICRYLVGPPHERAAALGHPEGPAASPRFAALCRIGPRFAPHVREHAIRAFKPSLRRA